MIGYKPWLDYLFGLILAVGWFLLGLCFVTAVMKAMEMQARLNDGISVISPAWPMLVLGVAGFMIPACALALHQGACLFLEVREAYRSRKEGE